MISILPHGPDSFGQHEAAAGQHEAAAGAAEATGTTGTTEAAPRHPQTGPPPVTFRREFNTVRRQFGMCWP
jgi:hypothetical protein